MKLDLDRLSYLRKRIAARKRLQRRNEAARAQAAEIGCVAMEKNGCIAFWSEPIGVVVASEQGWKRI